MLVRPAFFFAAFTFFLTAQLAGQDCPTIPVAVDLLLEAPERMTELAGQIEANCPAAADSLGKIYHKISVHHYVAARNYNEAVAYALRALKHQRTLAAGEHSLDVGKSLANLGVFYRKTGRFREALPYLVEADDVFAGLYEESRRFRNQYEQVYLWQATGDYSRSAELLDAILLRAEALSDQVALAKTLWLRSVQANQEEGYAAAIPDGKRSLAIYEVLGDVEGQMLAKMELGRACFYLDDYAGARRYTLAALAPAEQYGMDANAATMRNLLSLIALREGKLIEAEAEAERALGLASGAGVERLTATVQNTLAEIAYTAGQPVRAAKLNQRALEMMADTWRYSTEAAVPGPAALQASEYKLDLFELLAEQVKYLEKAGAGAGAREGVKAADALADLLRTDFSGEASKLFWRRQALPLYESGVRLSLAEEDVAAAYYYVEKSRSVLLLEALLEGDVRSRIDTLLATRLELLAERLRLTRTARILPADTLAHRERVVRLRDTLDELRTELAGRFPKAADLLVRPALADIGVSRAQLRAGGWDRQVHFLYGEERTYAFTLTAGEAYVTPLAPTAFLAPAVRALLAYFTGPAVIDADPTGYLAAAHRVYRLLLEPLNIPAGERLLILPDGLLAYLPFAALVTEAGVTDLGSAPYLIRRNAVSYGQSATVLGRQMRGGSADGKVLAFSPFTLKLAGNKAPALAFSAGEVAGLATAFGVDLHQDATAASRNNLLAFAADARLLHLSTHAYATPDGSQPTHILTATEPLSLPDIYGLDLKAELVTLSACESNIGPLARGEGVLGLGRAFAAAGARGVVASLWSLNDRATAEVVTTFYGRLAAGATKPAALHEAQLAYLERTDLPSYLKSPYYWAGLTYYGDGGTVAAGRTSWWWLAGGVVLVLAVVVVYRGIVVTAK
jgi:tetratricopeptide (TPR) repeat protein